jgi:hypothetical protein
MAQVKVTGPAWSVSRRNSIVRFPAPSGASYWAW